MYLTDKIKGFFEKNKEGDSYGQNTEAENNLLLGAQQRFEVAYAEKVDHKGEHLNSKFARLDRIYNGDQWTEHVDDEKSTPVLNYVFALIESTIPRLIDSEPEIMVLPRRSAADSRFAEQLGSILRYLWHYNKMQDERIEEAAHLALKYGTSIFKTIFNTEVLDGLGEIEYSVVHPVNFYPDPRATSVESMEYCFVTVTKPLEYFSLRWPDKGNQVKPDDDDHRTDEIGHHSGQEATATLYEYWFRDDNGDVSVMYFAGNIVLQIIGGQHDDKNPVYRHNKFPFARVIDYMVDKSFWGSGEIEHVEVIQRLINSFEAQIIDNTRLMANNQWLINKALSGLKEEDAWVLDNTPGSAIWTFNGGVERLQGVPIPEHIPRHMQELIEAMEHILGVHDVVQGRRPIGVRAASAIIALQEAANIRVRRKAKHLGAAIREIAEQSIALVMEFYDEPRKIRLSGEEIPVAINVREAIDRSNLKAASEMGALPPETQPMDMAPEALDSLFEYLNFPEFDIEVKVGPSVPYSQALLYEQAKEFFSLGVIDRKAVLDLTNFPDKEAILERMEEMESMMAQREEQERMGESM
jgi:hypothetical protein